MVSSPTSSPADIKLPLLFLVTGVLSFFLLNWLYFDGISFLATGGYRGPAGWMLAHLTLLGWGTMVAMGAMYQLIPVALQVSIFSEKLGYVQYVMYTAGTAGLLIGFYTLSLTFLLTSGILTVMGILAFIFNMLMSIKRMPKQTYISKFILSALFYLTVTIILGLMLVLNMKGGWLGPLQSRILNIHIIAGLVGWFTLLIIGFSYKMLPMFALSHGYSEVLPNWVLRGFHLGILLNAIALGGGMQSVLLLGLYTMTASFLLFVYDVRGILKKKIKKKLDIGMVTSARAIYIGTASSLLILTATIVEGLDPMYLVSFLYLFIYGWISLSILGYLYKIVPFLWWTKKYSGEIGKKNVPQLKDLISETFGEKLFLIMIIGLLGFSSGLLLRNTTLLYLFQAFIAIASTLFTYAVFRVFQK